MSNNQRRYPAVEVNEIIATIQSLPTTLDDVAAVCNAAIVHLAENDSDARAPGGRILVTDSMVMYTCMLHLFNTVIDGDQTWDNYPVWIKPLYERATICEDWSHDVLSGIVLTREMFDQWEADQAPVDLDPALAAEILQLL